MGVTPVSNISTSTGLPVSQERSPRRPGPDWIGASTRQLCLRTGPYAIVVGVEDDADNIAGSVKTFTLDTQVLPPVTVLVEATHADMTEAEAASAFDVTVEAGAQWTVELTGTKYADAVVVQGQRADDVTSAQTAKSVADDAVIDRDTELAGLNAILQAEISGLQTLEQALIDAVSRQTDAQTNATTAQSNYDTAYAAGRPEFVGSYADPDALNAAVVDEITGEVTTPASVVDAPIVLPGLTLAAGDEWTDALIADLQSAMDSFISDYSLTTQDPTVSQLALAVTATQGLLLDANSDVAGKTGSVTTSCSNGMRRRVTTMLKTPS